MSNTDLPKVPDYVLVCIHAYGDARADDDGTSASRLLEAIKELRQWAGSLAASPAAATTAEPDLTVLRAWSALQEATPGDRWAEGYDAARRYVAMQLGHLSGALRTK